MLKKLGIRQFCQRMDLRLEVRLEFIQEMLLVSSANRARKAL